MERVRAQKPGYHLGVCLFFASYLFVLIGICVDDITHIAEVEKYNEDGFNISVSFTGFCGWKEIHNSTDSVGNQKSSSYTYKHYCKVEENTTELNSTFDYCTQEMTGNAWLALTIVALIIGLFGWAALTRHLYQPSHYQGAVAILLFSIFCFAAVGEWGNNDQCTNSCSNTSGCTSYYASSWVLVLVAGILSLITTCVVGGHDRIG